MMKIIRKTLSVLLTAVLLLSCSYIIGFAESTYYYAIDTESFVFKDTYDAAEWEQDYLCTEITVNYGDEKTKITNTYNSDSQLIKTVTDEMGLTTTTKYSYDEKGNTVKEVETTTDDDGYSDKTVINRTYKNNLLTKETETYTDCDGYKEKTIDEYTYDKKGRLTKSVVETPIMSQVTRDTQTITYDKKGRISNNTETLKLGKILISKNTVSYEYDKKGNVVKEKTVYKSNYSGLISGTQGSMTTQTTVAEFTYDSKNRIIGEIYTTEDSENDKEVLTITREYDENGLEIKQTAKMTVNGQVEDTTTTTTAYNADGNPTKITAVEGTSILSRTTETTTFTYDGKGRLTDKSTTTKGGLTSRTKKSTSYTYDKNGNLIKEIEKDNSYGESTIVYSYKYKKASKKICIIDDSITLSGYSFTANGKAKKPSVYILGMENGVDYTLTYKNNIKPGKGKIIIDFTDKGQKPVTVSFDIKPAKVQNLKASAKTKTSVTLRWDNTEGAKKYLIYQYDESTGKYSKITTATKNTVKIDKLKSGQKYVFCVKAVAAGGVKGDYSKKISVKTK